VPASCCHTLVLAKKNDSTVFWIIKLRFQVQNLSSFVPERTPLELLPTIRPDLPEVREVGMKTDDQTTTMQPDYLTCSIDSGTGPKSIY